MDLDPREDARGEYVRVPLALELDTCVDGHIRIFHPEPKEGLHTNEAGKLKDGALLVLGTAELKVLKEVGNGGSVPPWVDALDLRECHPPRHRFELRKDGVFRREGGAKYSESQPGRVQDNNVVQRTFTDVDNLYKIRRL